MAEDNDGERGFTGDIRRAEESLSELADGRAVEAAKTIEDAFSRTGRVIEGSLSSAARTGELAFSRMAQSVLQSLADIAIERVVQGPLANVLQAVPFPGQRADGGPVTPGRAYLVGERGPEIFTPASAGAIEPQAGGDGVTVHFHLGAGADADSLQRSSGQVAALVARAVARGRRRL